MMEDALRYAVVMRFLLNPGSAKIGVPASMAHAVRLGNIMQKTCGPHLGNGHRKPGHGGLCRKLCRHIGYQQAVRPDIVKHAVFVPQPCTFLVIRDMRIYPGTQIELRD